jgi:hypothetical protein
LGAGANLTTFQLFLVSILQKPAVSDADALVRLEPVSAFPRFAFYRQYNTAFSWLIAEQPNLAVIVDADAQPQNAIFVSGDYFKNLGINAAQGHLLEPQDDLPGATPVVVLAYDFWLRRFAGDLSAIGSAIRVNERLVQIAGIVPAGFHGLYSQSREHPSLWFPIRQRPHLFNGNDVLKDLTYRDTVVYGKLRPGITQAAAEAHLASLAASFRNQYSEQPVFWALVFFNVQQPDSDAFSRRPRRYGGRQRPVLLLRL